MMVVDLATNHSHEGVGTAVAGSAVAAAPVGAAVGNGDWNGHFGETWGFGDDHHVLGYNLEATEQRNFGVRLIPMIP